MTLYHVLLPYASLLHICSPTSSVGPTPSMQPSGTPAVVVPDTAASTLTIIAANLSDMFAGKWLYIIHDVVMIKEGGGGVYVTSTFNVPYVIMLH